MTFPETVRPPTRDRQPKISVAGRQAGKTGLARITTGEGGVECSCGWAKVHPRAKVAGDAAERHVNRVHQGRAVWL